MSIDGDRKPTLQPNRDIITAGIPPIIYAMWEGPVAYNDKKDT